MAIYFLCYTILESYSILLWSWRQHFFLCSFSIFFSDEVPRVFLFICVSMSLFIIIRSFFVLKIECFYKNDRVLFSTKLCVRKGNKKIFFEWFRSTVYIYLYLFFVVRFFFLLLISHCWVIVLLKIYTDQQCENFIAVILTIISSVEFKVVVTKWRQQTKLTKLNRQNIFDSVCGSFISVGAII